MNLTDSQHQDCFIVMFLPHLRNTLSQQKIGTQAEVLEIKMRLHETPIQDMTLGVQKINVELQNICLEFQIFEKEKVAWP